MAAELLRVANVSKRFGGLAALKDLTFSVAAGEIVGLIGPNGAGKTTAFNVISGTLRPTSGSICFDRADITGERPSRVVKRGLVRTFQATSIYPREPVSENVYRGALGRIQGSGMAHLFGTRAAAAARAMILREVDEVLALMGLHAHRDVLGGALPYGLQKRLGVAIALATKPRMLLLDEPAAGLNAEECHEFGELLKSLRRDRALTLLLVEHHMALVMTLCERIVVLVQGTPIAAGTPEEVRADPAVVEAYLGAEDHAAA